mgnify:CR=1 FL=1
MKVDGLIFGRVGGLGGNELFVVVRDELRGTTDINLKIIRSRIEINSIVVIINRDNLMLTLNKFENGDGFKVLTSGVGQDSEN